MLKAVYKTSHTILKSKNNTCTSLTSNLYQIKSCQKTFSFYDSVTQNPVQLAPGLSYQCADDECGVGRGD